MDVQQNTNDNNITVIFLFYNPPGDIQITVMFESNVPAARVPADIGACFCILA